MSATTTNSNGTPRGTDVPRGIGLHGRVAVTWATSGGILLGGILVAAMTLSGQLSGHGLFFTSSGLFVIGAVLGLLHGSVLGFFGRPEGTDPRRAGGDLLRATLYAIPALAVGWLATVWIGMTMVALYLGDVLPMIGVAASWAAGLALVGAAVHSGWRALGNAYARWPQRRLGTALVAAVFAALLVIFLADRPEIWGLRMRVTEVGAVLLAAALSIWVVGPAVTLGLHLLDSLPTAKPAAVFGSNRVASDVGIGLLVGLVLGILTVPFAGPSLASATGTAGAVVTAVSEAVVNEIMLRLVVLTSVAWLLLRWQRVQPMEAAAVAVALTTVVQVLLYTPGVLAIGFPTTLAAGGFVLTAVALPALAFGILYWTRGLGSALVADATTVAAMAILIL